MKKLLSLILAILIFLSLLISCDTFEVPTKSPVPTGTDFADFSPSPLPTCKDEHDIVINELNLDIELKENQRLYILDAEDNLVLFSVEEMFVHEMSSGGYLLTGCIGLYDIGNNTLCCKWIPEKAGWFKSGAISGRDAAVCIRANDFENEYPADYSVVELSSEETVLLESIDDPASIISFNDGSAMLSYYSVNSKFGIMGLNSPVNIDITFYPPAVPVYYNMILQYGEQYCYMFDLDGIIHMWVMVHGKGVQYKESLEEGEYLSSACYSKHGAITAVKKGETGTTQLLIFNENGRHVLCEKLYHEIYRPVASGNTALAVDEFFNVYLLQNLDDLEKFDISRLNSYVDVPFDSHSCYFYSIGDNSYVVHDYTDKKLYLVTISN